MDTRTEQILKLFNSHLRIKNFLTILSYFLIIGGVFVYVFYAFNQNQNVKLVNKFKDSPEKFETEKMMTNPRIKFQYSDKEIYDIRAKKAFHKDNQEVILYDVTASGAVGNIIAGELNIDEEGNHLVFSNNPVLIIKKTGKK